jgi:hypothetical protein
MKASTFFTNSKEDLFTTSQEHLPQGVLLGDEGDRGNEEVMRDEEELTSQSSKFSPFLLPSAPTKSALYAAKQWFYQTPERALNQAYNSALTIKSIEDEYFQGSKISNDSTDGSDLSNNLMSFVRADVEKELMIAKLRLAEFKTSCSILSIPVSDHLDKLSFLDEVLAKYTSQPNPSDSQPNPSDSQPNLSASKSNLSASKSNLSASQPNLSASQPNPLAGLVPLSLVGKSASSQFIEKSASSQFNGLSASATQDVDDVKTAFFGVTEDLGHQVSMATPESPMQVLYPNSAIGTAATLGMAFGVGLVVGGVGTWTLLSTRSAAVNNHNRQRSAEDVHPRYATAHTNSTDVKLSVSIPETTMPDFSL